MRGRRTLCLSVVAAGCAILASALTSMAAENSKAEAAKPQQAQKPVSSTPQSTTETYGDWILICSAAPTGQVCEVDTSLSVRGQAGAIARVAFAKPTREAPLRLIVQTPVNVLIAPGVKVESEAKKTAVALVYRSCTPGGCFAEADLTADQAKAFRGRTEPGQITLTDSSGRAFALPFTFTGFDQALDALARK